MFHSHIELKADAIFIADAHYSKERPQLLEFLENIQNKKIKTTQLIFMGDIFDLLIGGVASTYIYNKKAIKIINDISLHVEVIYLEGNHDFNLKKIFTDVKIFSLSQQPLTCSYNSKTIALAHGDFDGALGYRIYSKFIRASTTLTLLKPFESYIIKKLDNYLKEKDDCKEFVGFREFIKNRNLEQFNSDYFIDGHFHQDKSEQFSDFKYINLGAFACDKRHSNLSLLLS